MSHASRRVEEGTGTNVDFLVSYEKAQLSLKDNERLIVAQMPVPSGPGEVEPAGHDGKRESAVG